MSRLPLRRLAIRVCVFFAALIAVDAALTALMPSQAAYLREYRLPRVAPTSALADYVAAIDGAAAESTMPIVVFLGASPTYGHRIEDAIHTFPYAFAAAAASDGVRVRCFNLGLNGAYVGDEAALAEAVADDADIVFVQLTYHTFARTHGPQLRYPEIPSFLGTVGGQAPGTRTPSVTAAAIRSGSETASVWLGRRWRLWRYRDTIDRRLFGGAPRAALDAAASRVLAGTAAAMRPTVLPEGPADDGFGEFDELDPGAQMVVVARYAEDSSFTVAPTTPEMASLDHLAGLLAQRGTRAVFFMGPLNWQVIDDFELIETGQYRHNVRAISRTVARHGFELLDPNQWEETLAREDFADISHTTDLGGRRFGELLYRRTSPVIKAVRR